MKILILDLETTGLDCKTCQILEVGMLYCDLDKSLEEAPSFQCFVRHELIVGEAYALKLNSKILGNDGHDPEDVTHYMSNWLSKLGTSRFNVGGKNVNFDFSFLERLNGTERQGSALWIGNCRLGQRVFDPAILYWERGDKELPNMETCLKRAGLDSVVEHAALSDCYQVARLLRVAYGRLPEV